MRPSIADRIGHIATAIGNIRKAVAGRTLLVVLAFSSLAAAPVPDFVLKTDKVETSVFLDAKIKANPVLATSCLSEGRKWVETQHAENVEARSGEDPDLVEWRYQRDYRFLSIIAGRYVSVMRMDSWNTGHGYEFNTILWDKAMGRRISIRPFFRETTSGGTTMVMLQKAIIAALKRALEERGQEIAEDSYYETEFWPSLAQIGPVSLAPSTEPGKSSGLIFHYGRSYIGDHTEGLFQPFVPWESLNPYLTAEGAKIFGGTRPKGDSDDQ